MIESARTSTKRQSIEERSYAGQLESQKGAAMDLDRKSGGYLVLQRQAETQPAGVSVAPAAAEGAARHQQQPRRTTCRSWIAPRCRARRSRPTRVATGSRRSWPALLVALGLAFGIEYLDDTVKTPDDVTEQLRLPLLGLVPSVRGQARAAAVRARAARFRRSVPIAADVAGLHQRRRTGRGSSRVTSSQPLEGKTTTACNLGDGAGARRIARAARSTPTCAGPACITVIGAQNEIGLSHLLVGQARVRDAVQKTSEPNLFVITAGLIPPNPSELLSSERMNALLANLRSGPFDWVIIDTPPVLAVTDAVIVAQRGLRRRLRRSVRR